MNHQRKVGNTLLQDLMLSSGINVFIKAVLITTLEKKLFICDPEKHVLKKHLGSKETIYFILYLFKSVF